MKIHPLTTGRVRVKRSFLFPSRGLRRQLDLFLPGPWSDPLPIHCWAIGHEDRLLLIDSGETAAVRDIPFARFDITPEQELPGALSAAGLSLADVSEVVLTHHHGDHVDGLPHVEAPVLIHDEEQRHLATLFSRVMRRHARAAAGPARGCDRAEPEGARGDARNDHGALCPAPDGLPAVARPGVG